MLLGGIDHVAVLSGDTDRLVEFYREVFEATSTPPPARIAERTPPHPPGAEGSG